MPTLLQRVGPPLAAEFAKLLVRCSRHGPSPWVPTCLCVLEGATAAEATHASVLCADHIRLAEEGHPDADQDVETACMLCLVERGILQVG